MVDSADESLISVLRARDGVATEVRLRNGVRCRIWNIAWGYDDGDQWAHVTSNISPPIKGEASDLFFTSAVALVLDPMTGLVLYLDVARLLEELCVKLGFCLEPADRDRLIESPPESVESFTDAVLRAEGLDPTYVDSNLRDQMRAVVAKHFGVPRKQGFDERGHRRRR